MNDGSAEVMEINPEGIVKQLLNVANCLTGAEKLMESTIIRFYDKSSDDEENITLIQNDGPAPTPILLELYNCASLLEEQAHRIANNAIKIENAMKKKDETDE